MALRSSGRKLSFEILSRTNSIEQDERDAAFLYRSKSFPLRNDDDVESKSHENSPRKRKKRKHKKKKPLERYPPIAEDPIADTNSVIDSNSVPIIDDSRSTEKNKNGFESELDFQRYSGAESGVFTVTEFAEGESQNVYNFVELRQRNVNGSGIDEAVMASRFQGSLTEESGVEVSSGEKENQQRRWEPNGSLLTKLQTADSLDWKRLMADDPNYLSSMKKSPVKYFLEEMYSGNSLQRTVALGNEKERERVYDTIFRLPWRCELFKRHSAAELFDFGCLVVLTCGVALLERTDISLIYHMIRGQGTIKLYVVYNVLEIFDKLFQNFGGDVLQTLFNSAEELARCSPENTLFWTWRFFSDQALAMVASILHSFILLAQAITLSTCIVAHNNALLALLVSNNFAEIKSSVFKRFNKDNIHRLVYSDSIERFHISAFLVFVLAQNILEAEGPWFESFLYNALLVFVCEMLIDIIKHSFLAKFNDIKPIVYSEFLEELCKQTLNIQTDDKKNKLTFVPLAPACVVIRVLTPVYAARVPCNPLLWRVFWILLLFAVTYIMLASLKMIVGIGLQKHATWYVNRCHKRKHHLD
ncbi:protein POLLEN DEFECTIVE IN GUIDANCE 1 isoform X2 [Tripterygium wilfordii]|uniref:protein POLLEN DEFECTIVE IN GUIDANCE 1 isoform X2 n=1 Tax=Tripterygium wilfordii TaxID=458696 RepID=UPI0018F7FB19|nr:protein POLLEN DEFECTIVE IN GUIDANCE 1 isoform X2 [Tripterygium wilfordii]